MAGELLFVMLALLGAAMARYAWKRRRLPGERLGQWLLRKRRYDAESGYKDLALITFGCGLCITAGLVYIRHGLADLETPEKMLLGVMCFSFTVALPLLVWLVGKESKKRLAAEDEASRRFEEELRNGGVVIREDDDDDLDGR